MKTPVTPGSLKQHLTYSWWKYALLAVLAFGLVDLIYVMTAYRPPENKKVNFYVYGVIFEGRLAEYLDNVRETEMSDMEEMNSVTLLDDNNYGPMQLMTYIAAGEGDVYLLPRDQFISVAASGSLLALEDYPELMDFFTERGIALQSGWRKNTETGENHLYGIPQNKLPGLDRYAYAKDGFLCVLVNGGNDENSVKFLRILCRDMYEAPKEEPSPSPVP